MVRWTEEELSITPGILVIYKDFDSFNPHQDKCLHIPLREFISSNGEVQIFELGNLFSNLIEASRNETLLDIPKSKLKRSISREFLETIEIKPGVLELILI